MKGLVHLLNRYKKAKDDIFRFFQNCRAYAFCRAFRSSSTASA